MADEQWFNQQKKAVQNTLIAGAIQNFEFVYELSIKMLKPRKTSYSRFLAQALDSTALQKNARLTYG